jgi:hypothetical protein
MTRSETITLVGKSVSLELPSETLLVAVDDTGHEGFAPTHRVFGLGGCACLVKHYGQLIDEPWKAMKAELFGGVDSPMHASSKTPPSQEQLQALGVFFTEFQFFRFAVMAAETVQNATANSLIRIVCRSLLDRVAEICAYAQPKDVALIVENSDRIQDDLIFELSGYRIGDGEIQFEPKPYLLPKAANSSMLEVADFVIHAAGAQIRNRLQRKFGIRKDFDLVFYGVDRRLSYYVELLSINESS